MQTLHIIRGVPGSGKAALAHNLVEGLQQNVPVRSCTTDSFFKSLNPATGKWVTKFDPRLLGAAHDLCYGQVMNYLHHGNSVVVYNTFKTHREVDRYVRGIRRGGLNVNVQVIRCEGNHKTHVPARVVDRMREGFEDVIGEINYVE